MEFIKKAARQLNIAQQCDDLGVGIWQCPQFLFLVMGFIIIGSILATYNIAQRYTDAEIVALIVILLTGFLFIVSYVIVAAFERVVHARRAEAQRAKELIELKDQFVFIAAHELKTPAHAILQSMEYLEKKTILFLKKNRRPLII